MRTIATVVGRCVVGAVLLAGLAVAPAGCGDAVTGSDGGIDATDEPPPSGMYCTLTGPSDNPDAAGPAWLCAPPQFCGRTQQSGGWRCCSPADMCIQS